MPKSTMVFLLGTGLFLCQFISPASAEFNQLAVFTGNVRMSVDAVGSNSTPGWPNSG